MNSLNLTAVSSTASDGRLVRRLWRAPREHGAAVIAPAWKDSPQIVAENRASLGTPTITVGGISWLEWRQDCRQQCLQAACEFTRQHLGVELPNPICHPAAIEPFSLPLIVGGHQPELFHPGVWAKNFAIDQLARSVGGLSLHLIVDNDASQQSSVTVPTGDRRHPRRTAIEFDNSRPLQPWEGSPIADASRFESFAHRICEAMAGWQVSPIVSEAWPAAIAQQRQGWGLVSALTAARVAIERRWGLRNLELPMSVACEQPAFGRLVIEILRRLPEFQQHYNQVLGEYRQLNQVRSHSHPVPELVEQEGWLEAPFWIWRQGSHRRDRLWVQRRGKVWYLKDGTGPLLHCELEEAAGCDAALQQLLSLSQSGISLRSRALTTTLFARLGLADLFVHGLGGAKYDEMTDALMARFFRVSPPQFLTITATLHLPLGGAWDADSSQLGDLKHRQRDLQQNPQRYLSSTEDADTRRQLEEREQVVAELHSEDAMIRLTGRGRRRLAYQRLLELNAVLAAQLASRAQELSRQRDELEQRLAANTILTSREFSWVVYPENVLREVFTAAFPPLHP